MMSNLIARSRMIVRLDIRVATNCKTFGSDTSTSLCHIHKIEKFATKLCNYGAARNVTTPASASASSAGAIKSASKDSPDLLKLWQEHTRHEFNTHDTEGTLSTMVEDAYVNHIPVMTGGYGKSSLRRFYSTDFIPTMPPDTKLTPISCTVGSDQLVDEMILSFTHTKEMAWILPNVKPTGKSVSIPLVAIVRFRDGKVAHEHIYWDQASVLKQIGLIRDESLPVYGQETATKVLAGTKFKEKNQNIGEKGKRETGQH